MPAYLIALLRAADLDAQALHDYRTANTPLIERHGGSFVVRGGRIQSLEGAAPDRVVVIEFPDADAARAWYEDPDYQAIIALRQSAAETDILIVDGV
jgi:uncharacterized protein (DUF1330 family)